ncbi:maleylpyruvate isomerase family mycothiol-dependent enzyme [Thermomonospora amylolytica]|uniref:maleylpyruvate isomerase family mycothiol-dependent enzyme n=1 Tax=Thermomonospora amylolytica TaxID=1411117 RepID=UPI000E6B704D|nr:maleylpyruvate isomerase family mycothiol-dependent enzyme [Thermomonospora amylolytica]
MTATRQDPTPTTTELLRGLDEEYAAFADLIAPLDDAAWTAPTRCTGWQVRDVAGHVVLDVVESLDGTIGAHTPDEQAARLRDRSPAEVADLLRRSAPGLTALLEKFDETAWAAPAPVAGRTVYNGVLTLWYDTFVHADDIRAALGLPGRHEPAAVAACVAWLRAELGRLERGPLTLELDGLPRQSVGTGGPTVTGDPMRFVLAASGRLDPAALGLDEKVNVHLLP